MIRITRCVCTGRTFADLLAIASRECLDLQAILDRTGAGDQCMRCRPYLRQALRTGRTEFDTLLPADEPPPAPPPPPPATGKLVMSWSGGKDSALALYRLQQDPRYQVVGLLTTVSRAHRRISHHGVREVLLEQQAARLGLPLTVVYFPARDDAPPTMESFDAAMSEVLAGFRRAGVRLIGHGDLHLQALREYRERKLAQVGMRPVFPLWGEDPLDLLHQLHAAGFRAVITCAEPPLDASHTGLEIDGALPERLPPGVDPCGENGEYHSFVFDGPIFDGRIAIVRGELVRRDGRHYLDLLPDPIPPCSEPVPRS